MAKNFMWYKSAKNILNITYGIAFSLCITINVSAFAQATNQAIYLPPGASNQGAPPAPGDGSSSAPVTPGDSQRENVPTGRPTSAPVNGSFSPPVTYESPTRRSRVNLTIGNETVLTFQPGQLTDDQKSQVMGILPGVIGGQPYQNLAVSADQLKEMQDVLAPYPSTGNSAVPMKSGKPRSQIFTDGTMSKRLQQNGSRNIMPKFTVLRNFCRYLIIMGVVCACLFMAFASVGLIFGDRNAGARIIGAAGGLMLLLMAFAIWKVVRFNENNARGLVNIAGPAPVDLSNPPPILSSRSSAGDTKRFKSDQGFQSTTQANLPVTPANPGGMTRSGLPLAPLGSAH